MPKLPDMRGWSTAEKVVWRCYRRLFKKASPSADFDALYRAGKTKKQDWFMQYYLDVDTQVKIIEAECKKSRLSAYWVKRVKTEVLLGSAPAGFKK